MSKLIDRYKDKILNLRWVRIALVTLKRATLPGFNGLNIFFVATFFIQSILKGSLSIRAAAIAFNFFIAIFPTILVFLTLIPYVPVENFQEKVLVGVESFLPKEAFLLLEDTIDDLVNRKYTALLSISFLLGLFYATNTISALIEGFNQSLYIKNKRSFLKQKGISLLLLFIISFLVIVAEVLLGFGSFILSNLKADEIIGGWFTYYSLFLFKWVIVFFLFLTSIAFLYNAGNSFDKRWPLFNPGGIVATSFVILASSLFKIYVENFALYNKLYGSIGTLIIILLWIYFIAYILLIGFELNSSIAFAGNKKEEEKQFNSL
ncbi:MAG: YihY/virulence factor BrkB family protein [Luteibaculaceae bacterium]